MHSRTLTLQCRLQAEGLLQQAPKAVVDAVHFVHSKLCAGGGAKLGFDFEAEELAYSFRALLIEHETWLGDLYRMCKASEPVES
jgi:hypothetical protein